MAFLLSAPRLPTPPRDRRLRHRPVACRSVGPRPDAAAPRLSRRTLLALVAAAAASAAPGAHRGRPADDRAAAAAGLILFPLRAALGNEYFFLRAGETVSLSRENVARTNPVEKTSVRLHSLTRRGVEQALEAAEVLDGEYGLGPGTWIWASQNQSAQEAAHIIASRLRVRNEQVVPEFAFLDARGVGAMEGTSWKTTEAVLDEMDRRNPEERMSLGEDGTPNESAQDVFVRVRQLVAKLETQYSGEEILVVAPDSDTLSVLQAVLTNVPLQQHRDLRFAPGELRRIVPVVVERG
jgi:broad specificity phosphatase PhoE